MSCGARGSEFEDQLRELAPQVLGALLRRFRDFGAAEDAVQEALVAAATQWPQRGVPEKPRAWLIEVAARRLSDQRRSDQGRRRREDAIACELEREQEVAPDEASPDLRELEGDETLLLLFMCCHPALTPSSAIALTLRAVAGLTTGEIARAFMVPEATMAQRISRAKQSVRASGVAFEVPAPPERRARLDSVLHVLYLMFNEGYAATAGPALQRSDLAAEAIRIARTVHRIQPDGPEVAGLLALMLLTDARRDARTGPDGEIVPLDEQDRSRWDHAQIAEGVTLVTGVFARGAPGPYAVQAAIAALHDEAPSAAATDWPEILALYGVLEGMLDNPMVALSRAIAVAMVHGPRAGLELVGALDADGRLKGHHRLEAVRAHLLEMAGDRDEAVARYKLAAARTTSLPEQRYLIERAARLAKPGA